MNDLVDFVSSGAVYLIFGLIVVGIITLIDKYIGLYAEVHPDEYSRTDIAMKSCITEVDLIKDIESCLDKGEVTKLYLNFAKKRANELILTKSHTAAHSAEVSALISYIEGDAPTANSLFQEAFNAGDYRHFISKLGQSWQANHKKSK